MRDLAGGYVSRFAELPLYRCSARHSPVQSDKAAAHHEHCSDAHENQRFGGKARDRVAICDFEQVQGAPTPVSDSASRSGMPRRRPRVGRYRSLGEAMDVWGRNCPQTPRASGSGPAELSGRLLFSNGIVLPGVVTASALPRFRISRVSGYSPLPDHFLLSWIWTTALVLGSPPPPRPDRPIRQ